MGIVLVAVASRSKSCQKVEESSKSPKSRKGLKNLQRPSVRKNIYQSTNPPSIGYEELNLPLKSLTVFRAYFAWPNSSLDTIFESITDKAKRVELLMLCRVFPRGARKIFEPRTLESFTSCNQRSIYTKVCLRSARLPSATSALGYTPGTSTSRRLENSLRTFSFRYFSSRDTLQM